MMTIPAGGVLAEAPSFASPLRFDAKKNKLRCDRSLRIIRISTITPEGWNNCCPRGRGSPLFAIRFLCRMTNDECQSSKLKAQSSNLSPTPPPALSHHAVPGHGYKNPPAPSLSKTIHRAPPVVSDDRCYTRNRFPG